MVNQLSGRIFLLATIIILMASCHRLCSVVVGSRTVASSQGFTTFPNTDTNNRLLGFARFTTGFMLQDSTTSCTFEDYMPVIGTVHLNNGRFTLRKDMALGDVTTFLSPAIIEANTFSIEMPKTVSTVNIPETNLFSFNVTSSWHNGRPNVTYRANSIDWSFDDAYLAAGFPNNIGREVRIGFLSGTTITTTVDVNIIPTVNTVRWHPAQRYLAVGASAVAATNNLITYEHKVFNGTLTQLSGRTITSDIQACAWHPGGNFLIVGTAATNGQILTCAVSSGVLGTRLTTSIGTTLGVSREALSFSRGGNQIAIGLSGTPAAGSSNLFVYNFSAGSLTLTSSLRIAAAVNVLDWNPTSSYIAAGLATGTTASIRLYDASGTQVTEAQTARTGGLNAVSAIHWDKTGTYLSVATQVTTGLAQVVRIYYFDKVNLTLAQIFSVTSGSIVNTVRWSRSGNRLAHNFLSAGPTTHLVHVRSQAALLNRIIFKNGSFALNSDINLIGEFHAARSCKIDARGKRINFNDSASGFVVRRGSSILIENAQLWNVSSSSIRCVDDTGTVTLSNCSIVLSNNMTFSQGSILFFNDVIFSGTNQFNYTSRVGSTIASLATLTFDQNTTLNYAPARANASLIAMADVSSQLFLQGSTLISTSTGLRLSTGTLILDNNVTLSSSATFNANALWLDSGLNIVLTGAANVQFFGKVRYL